MTYKHAVRGVVLLLVLAAAGPARAQDPTGTIEGLIVDQSSAIVANKSRR